jgi:protoheme IX farnesyltransferase
MSQNFSSRQIFAGYVNLTRMRISLMVMLSCAIGYVLAYRGNFGWSCFCFTLLGTFLLSAGSCTLNCYIERDKDALMPRTQSRPIPSGLISPTNALIFGLIQAGLGALALYTQANDTAGFWGLVAFVVYVAIYTPAKRMTWLNTSIGAVPGALPPVIGWAAAAGHVDAGGWILFTMLFLWQHTHFFPIAYLYKNDYASAGFKMLPVLERNGKLTFALTALTAVALLPVSLMLYGEAGAGVFYAWGTALFTLVLIYAAFHLQINPSRIAARNVLLLSLLYLPLIFATVMIDRFTASPKVEIANRVSTCGMSGMGGMKGDVCH